MIRRKLSGVRGTLTLAAAAFTTCAVAQIQIGLFDTFADGQAHGWGSPNASVTQVGGADGASDPYLSVTSDGSGQGGSLAVHNTSSWIGDWQTAGVSGVTMFVKNPNLVQLEVRIVLFDGLTLARWTSTTAALIPANSGWVAASFSTAEANLTRVRGSSSYSSVIQHVNRFMVRHDAGTPTDGGTPIVGVMGLDNIRAVPEPASIATLAFGVFIAARRRSAKR